MQQLGNIILYGSFLFLIVSRCYIHNYSFLRLALRQGK